MKMKSSMEKKEKMQRQSGRTGAAAAYRVVGTTSDGVKILRAKAKPTHFTSKQIRATIDDLKRGSLPRS
jgi:hypothetical protein